MSKVFLVGAGPGAADLLTVRAVRVLKSADVILYDALVGREILALARSDAKLVNVGKRCGRKQFEQEEINSLLVYFARQSGVVVRLKGGDPLVFGRAAEEMDALEQAGIDFEVIPGVTAACSAAASARISLTDRRSASEVVLATAHLAEGKQDHGWSRVPVHEQTRVIYMPGRDYSAVQAQLRSLGFPSDTPCLVISRVSSPNEEVVSTTIQELNDAPKLPAPSVLIVGEVARQRVVEQPATRPALDSEIPEPSMQGWPL